MEFAWEYAVAVSVKYRGWLGTFFLSSEIVFEFRERI